MFDLVNIVLGAVLLLAAYKSVRFVPQGNVCLVKRFGRYVRTLDPGLNFIIPLIEATQEMSLMEEVVELGQSAVVTEDNVSLYVDGILYFKITDPHKAAYGVQDLYQALETLAMSTLRNTLGGMHLDKILSSRTEINAKLLTAVQPAAESWGVNVTRVEIKDIDPPDEIVEAMERQMTAERDKRAAIITSEGEQQAAINAAQGRYEAAKRDADAAVATAEGEAKAIKAVAMALKEGGSDVAAYNLGMRQFEALEAFATGQGEGTIIVVPAQLSALAAAIPVFQAVAGSGGTQA